MVFLAAMLLAGPQEILWTAFPEGGFAEVQCAGDVNGDGTEDIFAASKESAGHGIHCLDGLTGEAIWSNTSVAGVADRGCLRTVGDVDLDGTPELAGGAQSPSRVFLLCGATGEQIWSTPQDRPVEYVQGTQGPNPGDVAVLASRETVSSFGSFFALNGQSGSELWSVTSFSTDDHWIKVTETDINGNGWSEMGFSVDRGSAWDGFVTVRDGFSGDQICGQSTIYFGTMDICDSPVPSLAVSHFGDMPSTWLVDMPWEDPVWSIEDEFLCCDMLYFIGNVTGPYTPRAELLGCTGSGITLISGDDGYYDDGYPLSPVAVDCFHDGGQWRLAALTPGTFNAPPLVFSSPVTAPATQLPNDIGSSMCLLESDQYPTPLVAVAMEGSSGPGVCVLRTSWPVGIQGGAQSFLPGGIPARLVENPGEGTVTLTGVDGGEAILVDLSGRTVATGVFSPGEKAVFRLPPGIYHVLDPVSGRLLQRCVVIAP